MLAQRESPIQSGRADIPLFGLEGKRPLNEEQEIAISKSLGSNAAFIWGPPGTGKTTVLGKIVSELYMARRSVLLVSNTNIAVDTAMQRVVELLHNDPDFDNGAVLRNGVVVGDELKQHEDRITLDKVVARLSESLQLQLATVLAEKTLFSRNTQRLRYAIQGYELAASVSKEWKHEKARLEALHEKLIVINSEMDVCNGRVDSIKRDIERSANLGSIRQFVLGLNPEKLRRKLVKAEEAVSMATESKRSLEADRQKASGTTEELEARLSELSDRVQGFPPPEECRRRFSQSAAELRRLEPLIADLQKQVAKVRKQVLDHCRVLASTVYKTYIGGKNAELQRQFDVVIIDEASMLMLPMAFYAAGLATEAVIVAGDFRQLPPIVLSDEQISRDWLKSDAFVKIGIPGRVDRKQYPPYLTALRTQYRMRPAICGVTSDLFYGGDLKTHQHVLARPLRPMPLGDSQLLYVDTGPLHPWAACKPGNFSRYNLLHALLITKMAAHLSVEGYITGSDDVGIVAPYSAQVRLVKALIEDAGVSVKDVATVHSFQGNEKNSMIVDLTDSTGSRLGRFMQGVKHEDDGSRLLNVAISRARDHLIVMGNFQYLRSHAPSGSKVAELLKALEGRGKSIAPAEILSLDRADWLGGLHNLATPAVDLPDDRLGMFTEASFYRAFASDLERANESIIIASPFLTSRGAARWADHFRIAIQKGVGVRIVTRPGAEFGGVSEDEVVQTIDALRSLGVAVDLRARMHEKIALVDQSVAWHGSLNILSHRDTSESMLRLDSSGACRQLAELFCLPRGKSGSRTKPSDAENPACAACSAPTVLLGGRFGLYFECPLCGEKINQRQSAGRRDSGRVPSTDSSSAEKPCPIPGCNGRLVVRNGRYGVFTSCSNYPRCTGRA